MTRAVKPLVFDTTFRESGDAEKYVDLVNIEDIPSTSIVCRVSSSGAGPVGTVQLGSFSVLTRPGAADMVSTFIGIDEVLGRDGGGAIQGIKVTVDHMDDIPGDSVLLNPTGISGPVVAHVMADNSVLARVDGQDIDGLQAVGPGQALRTSGGGNNIGWGPLSNAHYADASVTLAKLAADVYQSAVVELGGDFDIGEEFKCVRTGDRVTVTMVGTVEHAKGATPTSGAGVVPAQYRPSDTHRELSNISISVFQELQITSAGTIRLRYFDNTGSTTTRDNSFGAPSATYNIT